MGGDRWVEGGWGGAGGLAASVVALAERSQDCWSVGWAVLMGSRGWGEGVALEGGELLVWRGLEAGEFDEREAVSRLADLVLLAGPSWGGRRVG